MEERGTGEFGVSQYECRSAASAVATFRIKFIENKEPGGYSRVLAYATFNESYTTIIDAGDSDRTLEVLNPRNLPIRTLKFDATVRVVQSCRHHCHCPQVRQVRI